MGGRATYDEVGHLLVLGDPAREGLLSVGDAGEDVPAGMHYLAQSGDGAADNPLNWSLRFEDPQIFQLEHVSRQYGQLSPNRLEFASTDVLDHFTPQEDRAQTGPSGFAWPSIAFPQRVGTLSPNRGNDIAGLVRVSDLDTATVCPIW